MIIYIYGLYDPRTNELRYIGKSKNPKQRLFGHLNSVKNGEISLKTTWLKELIENGYVPLVKILEKTNENDWEEAEKRWIEKCRSEGLNLLNVADGGSNPPDWLGRKQSTSHVRKRVENRQAKGNYAHSEETRKKISEHRKGKATGESNGFYGKQHPKEIMDRIIRANKGKVGSFKGKQHTDGTKEKIREKNKNYKATEETRNKISDSNKGRKHSAEFSEKISQRMLGSHLSEETKEKLRQANLGRHHTEETKKKISELSKNKIFPVDFGDKMRKIVKEKWQDTEYKEKMKEMRKRVQQEKWNDPEYRAKMLDAQRKRREREAAEKARNS